MRPRRRRTADPTSTSPVHGTQRRIVLNTGIQAAGEITSRLLNLAFYAVMARRLGPGGFGNFTLGLSLIALMLLADSAIDDILSRDVARDGIESPPRTSDALVAKVTVGAITGVLAIAFTFVADYSWTVRAAVALLVLGSLPELAATTFFAVRRGLEDFRTGATGLLIMRTARTLIGIAVLLAGGGIISVAAAYAAGGLIALAYIINARSREPGAPHLTWSSGATMRVLGRAWPLVAAGALDTLMISVGPIVLSLVQGASAVGAYAAGIRLALVAQFLGVAVATAVLPLLARTSRTAASSFPHAVESSLKAATVLLLPVAVFLALFASTAVSVIYGHRYTAAVTATRILSGVLLVRGVAVITFTALLARNRFVELVRIPAAVFAGYIVLLGVLVPLYSVNGSATALLVAEAAYAVALTAATVRVVGTLSIIRITSGPLVGAVAMLGAAEILGRGALGIVVALSGYLLVLSIWERAFYSTDLTWIIQSVLHPIDAA